MSGRVSREEHRRRWAEVARFAARHPGASRAELAAHLGLTERWLSHELRLLNAALDRGDAEIVAIARCGIGRDSGYRLLPRETLSVEVRWTREYLDREGYDGD